jgi:thioredoxin-like negative regulator of GroEL
LSNASTKTKARWNSANYVQIKVSIYPEIAEAFKAACTNNGVSMASVLSQFMAEYGVVANAKKTMANPVSSRKKRRNLVNALICQLEQVRDAEEQVLDNTPENLRNSSNFETTEGIISSLDEVIETLDGIY